MKLVHRLAGAAALLASVAAFGGAANAASTLNVSYFDIANPGYNTQAAPGSDFGTCCSSGPATGEGNFTGTSLLGGLPVNGAGGNIADLSTSGQILWWTPGTVDGGNTIQAAGSGVITLPFGSVGSSNMYANGATDDSSFYETAVLSGTITATGTGPHSLSVTSDDDALIYINGAYVGGNPGVHGDQTFTYALTAAGPQTLDIFYADRARTGAELDLSLAGAVTSAVPEPATWAMMLVGLGGLGVAMRSRRKQTAAAALA